MIGSFVGPIGPCLSENAVWRKWRKSGVEMPPGVEVELQRRFPWYFRPSTAAGKQCTLLSTGEDEEEAMMTSTGER